MKVRIAALALMLFALIYAIYLLRPPITEDLAIRLRKVRNEVNHTNDGGCGYTAKYIKQYLDSVGIESTIVQIDSPFVHFMVAAPDGTYVDKNGFFSRWYPPLWKKTYPITPDSLQKMLNDSSRWNKKFDRSDSNKLKHLLLDN